MAHSFTVQDLPVQERPRERLQRLGGEALSAQELLALLLGRGVRGEPVMTTAQELLARFGSLSGAVGASLEDLQSIKGLGVAKAAQLAACFEVARRIGVQDGDDESRHVQGAVVASADDVYRLLKSKLGNYRQEHFVVASLDSRDRVLGVDEVAVGTVNASLVHPRETYDRAIRRRASQVVVAHNHPSGDATPSGADRVVTQRLVEAGRIIGIPLLDHVIVTKTGWHSFKESEML